MSGLPVDCYSAKGIIVPKICISFQNPSFATNFVEILDHPAMKKIEFIAKCDM